jgi:hypothetical protein
VYDPGVLRVYISWRCSGRLREVECSARTDASVSGAGAGNLSCPRGRGGAVLAVWVQIVAIEGWAAAGYGENSSKGGSDVQLWWSRWWSGRG